MKKLKILLLAFWSMQLPAQESLIINTQNRDSQSLNGQWKYIVDAYENGYYNYRWSPFDEMEKDKGYMGGYYADRKMKQKTDLIEYNFNQAKNIEVPGDWNSQVAELFNYEGTVWYRKTFNRDEIAPNKRYFLYFGAANYESHVYLNAKKLGVNIGGFTPFQFEVTNILKKGTNSLVVKVDNKRHKDAVPTINTDWWNYGGITRDVKILEVAKTFIADYQIQLNPQNPKQIKGFVQCNGNDFSKGVVLKIPELQISTQIDLTKKGRGIIEINDVDPILWCPENPKLYTVSLTCGNDTTNDKIGFRTISTKGGRILLNGKDIFLRGICLHEENPFRGGRSFNQADARLMLGWVKEMNGNYARLAHYPHNEYMARAADEMGILLWEEIPVYWTINWNNEATYKNAENQLIKLINRDKNRASVIIWSMANETPVIPERTAFLGKLAATTRSIDNTRLLSAAMETHGTVKNPKLNIVNDPASEYFDVVSFNQYNGWYSWLPNEIGDIRFDIKFNKPVIISEFGGGAKAGYHADSMTRWSEEFQAYLYRESVKMLEHIPNLAGLTPWILSDFRSPRRPLGNIQDGYNRKGLISDRGVKKEAFYVMQEYYKQVCLKNRITAKSTGETTMSHESVQVDAPFEMPDIKVPIFPNKIFNIVEFGAIKGGQVKNTHAIAKAIEACHLAGGGVVYVPPGQWLTGAIHLKSNVNLHVDEDAELLFSDHKNDYLPAVHTSWEGMECYNYSPLVYAIDCENIAISGKGTLRAIMDNWLPWYNRPPAHMNALKKLHKMASTGVPVIERQMAKGENNMRPQFIQFYRCHNILIEDISIKNSPFWVIHPVLVNGGVVRRVNIYAMGHNNDGCDPEFSSNLLIENCVFEQGDDAISIKSGRNQDGWRIGQPSENIVIRNCVVREGNQMLAIGSELSGGVRNVYMTNCSYPYRYKARMANMLYIKTNHRRGGFVENIYVDSCHVGKIEKSILAIETDVLYQWRNLVPTYETRYTTINNIVISNIKSGETRQLPIQIAGDENMPIKNIVLNNVTVDKVPKGDNPIINVEGFTEKNVNYKTPGYTQTIY